MDTVVGESEAEIGSLESLLVIVTDIITEDHDVFTIFAFQYACVEGQRRFVRNVMTGKDRFGISRDTGFCFEERFVNRFKRSWHFEHPPIKLLK